MRRTNYEVDRNLQNTIAIDNNPNPNKKNKLGNKFCCH